MNKLITSAACIGLALSAIQPCEARQTYAAYEGTASIRVGTGGTRITRDGVDFWTTGDPPRRYQILGILKDSRYVGMITPDPVGARSIVGKIRQWGGDAAILIDQSARMEGFASTGQATTVGSTSIGSGVGVGFDKTTTLLLIVKYLPGDQAADISAPTKPPAP